MLPQKTFIKVGPPVGSILSGNIGRSSEPPRGGGCWEIFRSLGQCPQSSYGTLVSLLLTLQSECSLLYTLLPCYASTTFVSSLKVELLRKPLELGLNKPLLFTLKVHCSNTKMTNTGVLIPLQFPFLLPLLHSSGSGNSAAQ